MGGQLQKNVNINPITSNSELYSLVGAYIGEYKRLNRVSYGDIGSYVGCSRQAIHSLVKGNGTYSSSLFLCRVAGVFGLSLIELLDEARKLPRVERVVK
jgi:hypothetical protein